MDDGLGGAGFAEEQADGGDNWEVDGGEHDERSKQSDGHIGIWGKYKLRTTNRDNIDFFGILYI